MSKMADFGLGKRLALARTLGGISARELDLLAGRGQGSARLIESGRDAVAGGLLCYSEICGISLDWLIAGKGPKPEREHVQQAVAAARARRAAPLPRLSSKQTQQRSRTPRKVSPSSPRDAGPTSSRGPAPIKKKTAKARRPAARRAA